MPHRLFTTYTMLPRGGTDAPPPSPPPPPPPPPPQGYEEEDSDDEEFFADLPADAESEEAAMEQGAILASFETWCHDQSAQDFMAAEWRTAAARMADEHAAARADAHRRNIEAARAAMALAEQCLAQADLAGGLAAMAAERQRCEHQYPLPSFDASAQRQEERRTFTSFIEDAERRRRERVSEESHRYRGMVSHPPRRSDDGAGSSNAPPPPPSGASGADVAGGDSDEDVLFYF
jgi:hypothetical protein